MRPSSSGVAAWLSCAAALMLAGTGLLSGCGTKVDTPVPESRAKVAVPESGSKPLDTAQQKKAIDELMAQRDQINQKR